MQKRIALSICKWAHHYFHSNNKWVLSWGNTSLQYKYCCLSCDSYIGVWTEAETPPNFLVLQTRNRCTSDWHFHSCCDLHQVLSWCNARPIWWKHEGWFKVPLHIHFSFVRYSLHYWAGIEVLDLWIYNILFADAMIKKKGQGRREYMLIIFCFCKISSGLLKWPAIKQYL